MADIFTLLIPIYILAGLLILLVALNLLARVKGGKYVRPIAMGLMKVALCLKHRRVPPNLHFQKLNPRISLDGSTLVIPTELTPWLLCSVTVGSTSWWPIRSQTSNRRRGPTRWF